MDIGECCKKCGNIKSIVEDIGEKADIGLVCMNCYGKMDWIRVKDKEPPKTEPFLAYTTGLIEMMEWKDRIVDGSPTGWFGFYCPCSCCSGHCSDEFQFWMPLPSPPKE